jgi:DNA-3-methyladenine glycosylase II
MAKRDQVEHLKKDPKLRKVIETIALPATRKDNDLYLSLLRAIVGQQLSVKAAQTIWGRFLAIYGDNYPSPQHVIGTDIEVLRKAGLSYQKAGYLGNIARFALEETLDYERLKSMKDDDLIEYLVQIKGVGRWTVEMILMFNLGRADVFPKDDLGIQTGIKMIYKVNAKDKKSLYAAMEKISQRWKPYRTLACMYLWKAKDSAVKQKTRTAAAARVEK